MSARDAANCSSPRRATAACFVPSGASSVRPCSSTKGVARPPCAVARNVEIKARVGDLGPVEARARTIATEGPVQLSQDDTFFPCARGRLKLRQFADGRGELIHYFRDDESGPKVSDYLTRPIPAPRVCPDPPTPPSPTPCLRPTPTHHPLLNP